MIVFHIVNIGMLAHKVVTVRQQGLALTAEIISWCGEALLASVVSELRSAQKSELDQMVADKAKGSPRVPSLYLRKDRWDRESRMHCIDILNKSVSLRLFFFVESITVFRSHRPFLSIRPTSSQGAEETSQSKVSVAFDPREFVEPVMYLCCRWLLTWQRCFRYTASAS